MEMMIIDCISREEVLKLMQDNWNNHNGDWAMQESMDDIRALPSVTLQPKIEALEQDNALDKIRAEMELHRRKTESIDPYDLIGDCLDIIDKYKTESEMQNADSN